LFLVAGPGFAPESAGYAFPLQFSLLPNLDYIEFVVWTIPSPFLKNLFEKSGVRRLVSTPARLNFVKQNLGGIGSELSFYF